MDGYGSVRSRHATSLAVPEVHILWITAGLGCDGDSVSITAATQPSIEDVLLGAIPGLPKVHLHNPVLAYENGDEFLKFFHRAAAATARAVRARRRRLDPEREDQARRLLGGDGHRPGDRSADHAPANGSIGWRRRRSASSRSAPARPTAASTRWRAIRPAAWAWPTTSGWDWRSKAGLPIVNVPGCPVQPDNFMETVLYLLYQVAGLAPMIPLDEQLRPTWLFGKTVHEGCDRAGYYEQGDFATEYGSPKCIVKLGLLGTGRQLQRAEARLDGRHRRLPERRRHLHRLHDARLPGQVHAVHGRAAGREASRPAPVALYGRAVVALRSITNATVNKEPKWRHPRPELTTGYQPRTF